MGSSEFREASPLPSVPLELSTVLWSLQERRQPQSQWNGKSFLNQDFTLSRLQDELNSDSFDIVHLATHAEFLSGQPNRSYIQLWDTRLRLNQIDSVGWDLSPVELLVLSACRTALGDDSAELGFAGLALKAGVKSALASLWYVSDFGTLALMSELYQHLGTTSTKAEALRRTQLNMIEGKVRVEGNQLILTDASVDVPIKLASSDKIDLSHPFYWAGFTMISSPW